MEDCCVMSFRVGEQPVGVFPVKTQRQVRQDHVVEETADAYSFNMPFSYEVPRNAEAQGAHSFVSVNARFVALHLV